MAYTPPYRRKTKKPKHDRFDKITLVVAIIGVTVIAISAGIAAWQAIVLTRQQLVMTNQLTVMQAQNRPWVTIPLKPTFPLEFETNGALDILLSPTARNVGQAFASGVYVAAELVTFGLLDTAKMLQEQARFCNNIRNQTFRTPETFGFGLFPGDERDQVVEAQLTSDQIEKATVITQNKRVVPLMIIGCVDYQTYLGPEHHQTRFAYDVDQVNPSLTELSKAEIEMVRFPIEPGKTVSLARLRFNRSTWGNGYAD